MNYVQSLEAVKNGKVNYITLTPENIATEHICCAISDKKSAAGVDNKKQWLLAQMPQGLKFVKADLNGKAFIEYIPIEHAWVPVEGKDYNIINCFWVAGGFKHHGIGTTLLEKCEADSKAAGKKGLAVISSPKKKPFLSDPVFLKKHGFKVVDTAAPFFELYVKSFDDHAPVPQFCQSAKKATLGQGIKGIDIVYTNQCPFTSVYINLLKPVIASSNIPVRIHQITSRPEALDNPVPVTTYNIYIDGVFYTNEILSPEGFSKLLSTL